MTTYRNHIIVTGIKWAVQELAEDLADAGFVCETNEAGLSVATDSAEQTNEVAAVIQRQDRVFNFASSVPVPGSTGEYVTAYHMA